MPRAWIWLQLLLGWLPMGTLFALLFFVSHGGSFLAAIIIALQMMLTAAALGIVVHRYTQRVPWPHPLHLRFIAAHVVAASAYALTWSVLNVFIASSIASVLSSIERGSLVLGLMLGPGWGVPYVILGVWLYVMVAGITYANQAAARSAQIEALAARTQLAALRAQLHPHLLFNALHTVVQLIPIDPKGATQAAEQLADILRIALAESRDVIPLAQEWEFVQRYLAIESLRFGDRLVVHAALDDAARRALLPAFAVQTLVENAVRHAAAPRAQATTLSVTASVDAATQSLTVVVADDGPGADSEAVAASSGTGIRRLRERLAGLCGESATLAIARGAGGGLCATLTLAQPALQKARRQDGDSRDD